MMARTALAAVALLGSAASAAEIEHYSSDGAHVIFITGMIAPGDRQKFANIALSADSAVVVLISDGGTLGEAIEIGKAIRMKGFATYVPTERICASSCALIWLAGSPRGMSSNARIGFHAAYLIASGEVSSSANALIGSYLSKLNLSESAIWKLTAAAPTEMRWLSPAEAAQLGIEVSVRELDKSAATQTASQPAASQAAAATAQLEAQAADFVRRYVSFESAEASKSLELVSGAYAHQVLHFGKLKTRQEVIADYASFVERWPNRRYGFEPGGLTVTCSAQDRCVADALLNWEASSSDRNAKSTGITALRLVLSREGGNFAIEAVDGKVKSRQLSKLNPGLFCIGLFCANQ